MGRDRGMVFQAYTSFGWLTVRENVEYGLKLKGVGKSERRKISDKILADRLGWRILRIVIRKIFPAA